MRLKPPARQCREGDGDAAKRNTLTAPIFGRHSVIGSFLTFVLEIKHKNMNIKIIILLLLHEKCISLFALEWNNFVFSQCDIFFNQKLLLNLLPLMATRWRYCRAVARTVESCRTTWSSLDFIAFPFHVQIKTKDIPLQCIPY